MTYKIQIRRDTAANWTSTDPTLSLGEMGFETDTNRFKIGDGATAWTAQAYVHPGTSWCDLRPVSIVHDIDTVLVPTFTEAVDTDGYFKVGTPSRIFAPFTGLYFISWNIVYSSINNRFVFATGLNINGAGSTVQSNDIPVSIVYKSMQSTTHEGAIKHDVIASLTAGDYIEILNRQFGSQLDESRTILADQGGAQMRFIG